MQYSATSKNRFSLLAIVSAFVLSAILQMLVPSLPVSAVTYDIGDTGPAGGLIFYIDGNTHYEAAPATWNGGTDPAANWGCYNQAVPGADGTAIGNGEQNTADIMAFHNDTVNFGGNDYYTFGGDYGTIGCHTSNDGTVAAKLASDLTFGGADDWFLPSQDELDAMYTNLYISGLGGLGGNYFWSSSEYSALDAQYQYFFSGVQYSGGKPSNLRVRPARSFNIYDNGSTTISATLAPTITLSTSGTVTIPVTPESDDYEVQSHASDTVTVSTNSTTGYRLTLANQDTNTSLVRAGGGTIVAQSQDPSAPTMLSANSWGFRADGVASFGAGPTSEMTNAQNGDYYTWAGVPSSTTPFEIKSTTGPATSDQTDVWYGIEATTTIPAGTYTDTVVYTAVTN